MALDVGGDRGWALSPQGKPGAMTPTALILERLREPRKFLRTLYTRVTYACKYESLHVHSHMGIRF